MATHLLDAAFASIGLVDGRNPQRINFSSNLANDHALTVTQWAIDLAGHPTLNAAFMQDQTVELMPTGSGARQLHDFYGTFGIDPLGPLLIHPLVYNEAHTGLLVVAATKDEVQWTEDQKSYMPGLAAFIAQAIADCEQPAAQFAIVPPASEIRAVANTVPSAIFLDQVRLSSLKAERDELKSALDEALERRKLAEEKVLVVQKQARYLAAALRAAQESGQEQGNDHTHMDTIITGRQEGATGSKDSADQ
jgi:GAF domain-containing protein